MGAAMGGGAAAANVTNSESNRRNRSSSDTKDSKGSSGGTTQYSRDEYDDWMNWFEEKVEELPPENNVYPDRFLDESGEPLRESEIESRHNFNLGQKAVSKLGFSTRGMDRKIQKMENEIERLLEVGKEYEEYCAQELEEPLNDRTGLDSESLPEATEFDKYVVWGKAYGINRGSETHRIPVEEFEIKDLRTYVETKSWIDYGVSGTFEESLVALNKGRNTFVGSFESVSKSEVYLIGGGPHSDHASYFELVENSEIYAEEDQIYIEELKGDSKVNIDSSTNLEVCKISDDAEVRKNGEDVTQNYGGSHINGSSVRMLRENPEYFLGSMAASMASRDVFWENYKKENFRKKGTHESDR